MIDYPDELNQIFDKLQKNKAVPIIVGGFVRDNLLNIDSKDIDIEVYNIKSYEKLETILQEFGSVNSVGKSFGVCKLKINNLELDFSLPRTDSKMSNGHKGFNVKIGSDLDLFDAFKRRDFTVNAIGYDVINKTIIDLFDGQKDLKNRTLKAVDKSTFVEDPLRVLRAVQFCARFNLSMDKELFLLCKSMVKNNMLDELPKERVFTEINKLLLKSPKPSIGFELLKELGALKYFTKLNELTESRWTHILLAINEMAKLQVPNKKVKITLMLSILCSTFSEEEISSFIYNISTEKELIDKILPLVKHYKDIHNIYTYKKDDSQLYRLATKVNIEELLLLSRAEYFVDADNSTKYDEGDLVKKRAIKLGILNKKLPPLLQGRDLLKCGLSPSKEFSIILANAYEAQMDGVFSSYDEALVWLKNNIILHNAE